MIHDICCFQHGQVSLEQFHNKGIRILSWHISIDFSRKILEIKEDEKLSLDDGSKRFKVVRATIFRWTKRMEPKLTRNKPTTKLTWKNLKRI